MNCRNFLHFGKASSKNDKKQTRFSEIVFDNVVCILSVFDTSCDTRSKVDRACTGVQIKDVGLTLMFFYFYAEVALIV